MAARDSTELPVWMALAALPATPIWRGLPPWVTAEFVPTR